MKNFQNSFFLKSNLKQTEIMKKFKKYKIFSLIKMGKGKSKRKKQSKIFHQTMMMKIMKNYKNNLVQK